MTLLLNIFDYAILIKYYNTFLGERKRSFRFFFLIYSSILILSGIYVNSLGVVYFNIGITFAMLFAASLLYKERLIYKICLSFTYFGLTIISEVIALSLLNNIDVFSSEFYSYFAITVCHIIKLFMVLLLATLKTERNERLPKGTTLFISLILVIGTLGCVFINWEPAYKKKEEGLIGVVISILTFALIFFFVFVLLDKFNRASRLNQEQNLIIQESALKESYYREVDQNNLKLRKLKHNMKNQLISLYDMTENDIEEARNTLKMLLEDIDKIEGQIYTSNNALNSICKIKFSKATQDGIRIEYDIDIPEVLNINYGDMGILYGNLLDNAIEACEKLELERRFIKLKTTIMQGALFLCIENSCDPKLVSGNFKTTKKDYFSHGFGLKSVKEIVEKYNGIIHINAVDGVFKVEIILYQ